MLLRRHNLNLLPVLRELLRTRSVSRTAENIGSSPSAVSSALGRLREIYGDELLVLVGRRMELSAKALALIEPTERACRDAEELLGRAAFEARLTSRRFLIETADYATYLLAPALAACFAQEAPRASVHFSEYRANPGARLSRGAIDALVIPEDASGQLRDVANSARLFADDFVVIASMHHRAFQGALTRDIYESARHAIFRLPDDDERPDARARPHRNVQHNNVVFVESFLALPAVVERTDCLALVQRRLALRFRQSHAIEIHPLPFEAQPLVVSVCWSKARERDPALGWLRERLADAARSL